MVVLVKVRYAVVSLGLAILVLGCGRVRDEVSSGAGYAGAAGNDGKPGEPDGGLGDGGSSGVLDGAVSGAGGSAAGGSITAGACPGTQVRIRGKCVALGTVTPCSPSRSSGF